MTRTFAVLALLTAPLVGGCNRAHLYKTAGRATFQAFAQQAAPHAAPQPRGLDGEEASLLISTQKRQLAPSDESNAAPAASTGAKPTMMLQAK